ncbi:MAG: neprosin family prolyl endopeptidase [Candidatus Korobacteraceae bacterium]
MRTMRQRILLSVTVLLTLTLSVTLNAQNFVSFNNFLSNTASSTAGSYVGQNGYAVQDTSTFQQMQQYILSLYQGAQVSQSFLLAGQYFDCIPIQEQPSYVQLGLSSVASPPPDLSSTDEADTFSPQLGPGDQTDQFGDSTTCAAGTIPMRRITIGELSSFATLQDFFSKHTDGNDDFPQAAAAAHKYAYTIQNVNNLGGNSALNLWSPFVNLNLRQIFSLSQQWYSGGAGANLQTVEGGWQNYPAKYGDENSRLFIFWTADNYRNFKCYNLDCPAFVQIAGNWYLGGKFSNYSASNGTQYYFTMTWYLFRGNWWLALGNNTRRTWVGYYPGTIFRGGQMSQNAQTITYGGETVGTGNWGPMGSGAFAVKGYRVAAYQRQVYYIDLNSASQWALLNAQQPSPNCYTVNGPIVGNDTIWGNYFFFGGPGGGNNC